MTDRFAIHRTLSARLSMSSDDDLLALLETSEPRAGWGVSRTVALEGRPVFVKCLPLTDVELARLGSTANLFGLPLTYQYGVGSAGFGAARELAAHVMTTDWVLAGRSEHFPLLHHHRLLPLAGQTRRRDPDQLDRYVAYWDGDPAIRRFIEAREASEAAVVLFVEHVPHALMDWLPANQHEVAAIIDQAIAVTDFLRGEGAVHFDLNPSNVVTDGTRIHVADFGLFLDHRFDLGDDEREFLRRHRHYDIAEFVASLEWPVPGRSFEPGPEYRAALEPFRAVIDEMTELFRQLTTGPKPAANYDDDRIAGLLAAAG